MWPLIAALAVLGLSANEPSALLVVLVVLRSGRNRGVAFVAGWVTALTLVVAGAGFVVRLGLGPRPGGPRRVTLVIELVIGVALVGWSAWYWLHSRGRVNSIEVREVPGPADVDQSDSRVLRRRDRLHLPARDRRWHHAASLARVDGGLRRWTGDIRHRWHTHGRRPRWRHLRFSRLRG